MQHEPPESRPDQEPVVAFLGDPCTHGGRAVERVVTHGAMVFLAGGRALKLKRAVRFPYMDFSTLEKRRAACEAEVRLNRRTAPTLYRGVRAVVRRAGGALALGGEGEVVDWVVEMRRFDQEMLFDRLAARGALTLEEMRRLAVAVAAFHHAAAVRTDGGGAAAMRAVVEGNIVEMRGRPDLFAPAAVARLAALSRAALDRHAGLLDARRAGGFVRHGHGDLHLRNIVLLDGAPTLFDGIEFDESFAVVDVLYDLAFLLMDLERRGLRPLGNAVFNRYMDITGDVGGLALLPLFLSARAAIRAKVEAAMGEGADAAGYLDLALGLLDPPPARLVAVGGLSGSGKSTVARALAPALGAAPGALVLRSDVLRKRLFGQDETARLPAGAYEPAVTARVYAMIAERARAALGAGTSVVADAVYARPEERAAIESAAAQAGAPFGGVWLDAGLETRVARVEGRSADASDATADVVRRQEGYGIGGLGWVRVNAAGRPAEVLDAVRETLA